MDSTPNGSIRPFHAHRRSILKTLVGALVLLLLAPVGATAQEALSLADFEGWKEWPLYEPGDIEIDSEAFRSTRTWMSFVTPAGDVSTMHVDLVTDVFFKGEPALWIEHTGYGAEGDDGGTSVIDTQILDRETFRVLFRIAAGPGGDTWAGPYDLTHHFPDRIARTTINDDASIEQNRRQESNNPFDFVAMPYLVARSELLEEGRRFRLLNIGSATDLSPRPVGLLVKGETTVTDANGVARDVWHVELLSNAEHLLVDLYISEQPPYFMGWRFRRVANGATGVQLAYRDHVELTAR